MTRRGNVKPFAERLHLQNLTVFDVIILLFSSSKFHVGDDITRQFCRMWQTGDEDDAGNGISSIPFASTSRTSPNGGKKRPFARPSCVSPSPLSWFTLPQRRWSETGPERQAAPRCYHDSISISGVEWYTQLSESDRRWLHLIQYACLNT